MEKITTVEELAEAAKQKRAVVVPTTTFAKPHPAMFILQMPSIQVLNFIKCGMYIYQKEAKS